MIGQPMITHGQPHTFARALRVKQAVRRDLDPLQLPRDVRLPWCKVVPGKSEQLAPPEPEDEHEDVAGIQRVVVATRGLEARTASAEVTVIDAGALTSPGSSRAAADGQCPAARGRAGRRGRARWHPCRPTLCPSLRPK
ncbi:MAG: hypothetical protein ABIP19_11990 [Dermatophilaceae bacterium]